MKDSFQNYLTRKMNQYGQQFCSHDLAPQFIPYFNSQERIEVEIRYGGKVVEVRRGTVGVTTGWKPVFLLMHRVNETGSTDTLRLEDRVVKVISNRRVA
jgi:hypothetical protein